MKIIMLIIILNEIIKANNSNIPWGTIISTFQTEITLRRVNTIAKIIKTLINKRTKDKVPNVKPPKIIDNWIKKL
jgi:hypothetical protein